MTDHDIANSLNPFLHYPFAHCLCLLLEIHIFVANSRSTTRKIRRTCWYLHDRCKRVSIGTVLFIDPITESAIVTYKMFRYSRVRLTEIEAVDVRVAAHREIFSHRILLVACHVIKDKNRIWARLARWNNVADVGERKEADFVNSKQIFEILILRLLQRFWIDVYETFSKHSRRSGSRVSLWER